MSDFRIGVISDTHGLLRPEVLGAFRGVDHIVHAGDIGGREIILRLEQIAPVTFVPGNVDDGAGEEIVRAVAGGLRIVIRHILPRPHAPDPRLVLALEHAPADFVIFGHSHLPHDEMVDGVRYFNPASAGPRRFDYPVAVGLIERKGGTWTAWHVPLDERSAEALKMRMNQLSAE